MARKKNIALFMAILENDFSSAILEGAIRGAKEHDVNLIVFPMDLINALYADRELNVYRYQYNTLTSYMDAYAIDGVLLEYGTIASTLYASEKSKLLSLVGDKPVVLLAEEAEGYSSVGVDNRNGLVEVIEHLADDHHYTKIGHLAGIKDNYDSEVRLGVFKETLEKKGLFLGDDWIVHGNYSEYVEKEVTELYNRHPDIEAIVCANDNMAIGAARTLRKLGRKPGEDIAITGFDNVVSGFLHSPALTTVKADPSEISYEAMNMLCGEDNTKVVKKTIKTRMLKRESCGCRGFELESYWKDALGLSSDWRQVVQRQVSDATMRRTLDHELANVTREIVLARESEKNRYSFILDALRRLEYKKSALFLYDSFIQHGPEDEWVKPEYINMVGYYQDCNDEHNVTYSIGEKPIRTDYIIDNIVFDDGNRHDVVIIPLFFSQNQIGLLAVETDYNRFVSVYDMAGQISNTLYIIEMNEEHRRMENELEAASRSKSQFLANMSHEIRTPINAIIGFNEMILRENDDSQIDAYANDVRNAADALLLLVNDVLDFSKIEAGKMDLVITNYSLLSMIEDVVSMMASRANAKGLALTYDYDKTIPPMLSGDEGRIRQILINLVSNAVKYTESGEVRIIVKNTIEDNRCRLEIKVKDTGIGIKEEDIHKLFSVFERIEEKRNRNIEGTGLGINIITGLLHIMDSKLQVESVYGEGSEFSFVIYQDIVSETETAKYLSEKKTKLESKIGAVRNKLGAKFTAKGVKILVVDDNALNRKVIASLLKGTEIIVEQAESGRQCIEMVESNKYDVILLDHMMPEMDGIETLKEILDRNLVDTTACPIIALTANAIAGAKEEYLEAGFTDYLSKPVLPKDLYSMLASHIDDKRLQ